MKYNDINKQFSEWVSNYLADGWIINSKSMSGHQGEEAKVDLVKGDELHRIWISHEYSKSWDDREKWHGSTMVVRIGRWKYPAHECVDSWTTVWMKDLDIIAELTYYEINNKWYVTTEAEAVKIQDVRRGRYAKYNRDYQEDITSDATKEIAAKYLKNHQGYQRVSSYKISVKKHYSHSRKHTDYYVHYNGHAYLLV